VSHAHEELLAHARGMLGLPDDVSRYQLMGIDWAGMYVEHMNSFVASNKSVAAAFKHHSAAATAKTPGTPAPPPSPPLPSPPAVSFPDLSALVRPARTPAAEPTTPAPRRKSIARASSIASAAASDTP